MQDIFHVISYIPEQLLQDFFHQSSALQIYHEQPSGCNIQASVSKLHCDLNQAMSALPLNSS